MQLLLLLSTLLQMTASTFCGGVCPAEWYAFGLCGWMCGSDAFQNSFSQQGAEGLPPPQIDTYKPHTVYECPPCPKMVVYGLSNETKRDDYYDWLNETAQPCEVSPPCDICEDCDKALCLRSELVYNPVNETITHNLFTVIFLYNIKEFIMTLGRICTA